MVLKSKKLTATGWLSELFCVKQSVVATKTLQADAREPRIQWRMTISPQLPQPLQRTYVPERIDASSCEFVP